jgi:glycosyltransferase involved in cell wall biosynthesis
VLVGIAINASIIGEQPTGLGVYSINLIRALDRLRDDLVVYTSRPEALGPLRARIERVPAFTRPERGAWGHLARLAWVQTALRARLRHQRPRALLNTVPEGVADRSIPQVTVVHDLLPLVFPAEYPRQQHYFRYLVPRALRAARVVVADSESTRQEVARRYGLPRERIRVVYPGLDPLAFHGNGTNAGPPPAAPRGNTYFLYVGNLMPHKNVLRLVDAFAAVRRERPCRLVVRGSGRPAHEQAVRAHADALGLGEAVRFVDYASEADLRRLYAEAVAFVFPSLGEGFGLPVLEAMACGTPVITSRRSSLPEVAGEAALFVDPEDTVALADAMVRLHDDLSLRQELRQRGLGRIQHFRWESAAQAISAVLEEIT